MSMIARAVTTGSSPTVLADSVPPPSANAPLPAVGALLGGKYRVERVLGRGGMGVVAEATHVGLAQRVAIKFLRAETKIVPGALDRFVREARAAAGIRSEHVVRVFDTGVFETGEPYIVMELLSGEDLRSVIARRGPLGATEAASLAIEACEALSEAHALGIVHRDLKPANLFVTTRSDGTPLLKVLDFGISKVYGDTGAQTSANVAMGSPLYMSPEQIRSPRDVDARSDIWALGVVLYEALTMRPPFEGEGMVGLATAITMQTPRPLPAAVPPELTSIVMHCLEKDRALRFSTASELAVALRPFATDETKLVADRIARAATPRMRSTPPPSRNPPSLPPASNTGSLRETPPISGFEATVARSGVAWRMSRGAEVALSLGLLLCVVGGGVLVWSLHAKHAVSAVAVQRPSLEPEKSAAVTTTATASAVETVQATAPEVTASATEKAPVAHAFNAFRPGKPAPSATVAPSARHDAPEPDKHVDVSGALRDRK